MQLIVSAVKKRRYQNAAVSVGLLADLFYIVSNDHGRTQNSDFPVLDRKYPFLANLPQKIKFVSLR